MIFLQPLLLFFGVLISVPFIIHLIGERKYRPFTFSSLKFLREIERDSLQKLKLRQWLILLSRALWIAMLVATLAKPFFSSENVSPEPGIILIDKSHSTEQNAKYYAALKEITEELNRWEVVYVDEHSDLDTTDRILREKIIQNKLMSPNIMFISDFQDNEMTRRINELVEKHAENLIRVAVFKERGNAAVSQLYLIDDQQRSDGLLTIGIQVSQSEDQAELPVAHVHANGQSAGRVILQNEGYGTFRFDPGDAEYVRCVVRIPEDDYPDDNVRYLSIKNDQGVRLLCISEERLSGYHINAFEAIQHIDADVISPESLPTRDLRDYDMIWISGLYDLPERQREAIRSYGKEKPLVLSPGYDLRYISLWDTFTGTLKDNDLRPGFQLLSKVNSNYSFPQFNRRGFRIYRYYQSTSPVLYPVWELNNGDPLLVRRSDHVYLLLSPFLFEWNEMGLSPSFTRILGGFVARAVRPESRSYHTGDTISIPRPQYTVTTPGGERHRVQDAFSDTRVPGFYILETEDMHNEIAVNIPESETIQKYILPDSGQTFIWNETEIEEIHRATRGRNALSLFLILAVFFLILEMLLLRRGEQTSG